MSALTLLDVLLQKDRAASAGHSLPSPVMQLAERLIDDTLVNLSRLNEYERQFGSPDLRVEHAEDVLESVYRMYEQWLDEAAQVSDRAGQIAALGHTVANREHLDDACARVRARLGVTPGKIRSAIEQLRAGQLVSAEAVRNERRARIHRRRPA